MTAPAMTVGELQARVDRGIVWLDEHLPDWWRVNRPDQGFDQGGPIDLDALVMRDPCGCVLGQLLGNYYRAEIGLGEAVDCGFDTSARAESYDSPDELRQAMRDEFDALQTLWIRAVDQRRAGVDVP